MESFVLSSGYLAVFLLMVGESACIPIPSEVVMPVAGALAAGVTLSGSHLKLDLYAVIALGTLGNVVGSYIAWGVGRTGGRALVNRAGRFLLIRDEDLSRAERWFDHHGEPAVFVSRLLPVVRTFISLPAGAAEMSPVRFGIYTTLGSLPWTAGLAVAGYELGRSWHSIVKGFDVATYAVAGVVAVGIIAFFVVRLRQKRAGTLAGASTSLGVSEPREASLAPGESLES
ncbi:MAG: DedA family protein [Actinomycetota bacterium]|nr:DedA family protein [Actinomycetota bacterium]